MITRETIKEKILTDDRWLERGILAVYRLQTADEQNTETTSEHNGVGFNAFDARSGSYYAKWLESGRSLSGPHLAKARKLCLRYIGQLERIANGEIK